MSYDHKHKPPPVLRLASRIHDLIVQRHQHSGGRLLYALERLTGRLEPLARCRRQITLARERDWRHAQAQLITELEGLLRALPGDTQYVQQAVPKPVHILSMADIAQEFDQIDDEFGGWTYEAPGILTVVTQPITLEEIRLGTFEIRLNLTHLGTHRSSAPYELAARDPHPAACNEAVIHPHVRDGRTL